MKGADAQQKGKQENEEQSGLPEIYRAALQSKVLRQALDRKAKLAPKVRAAIKEIEQTLSAAPPSSLPVLQKK